ncbi:MAG: hypothetical protein ASARMPREDX12_009526 [Alectoria sarmentosa]|nr:MAG: hypothetical protein ASARMPREDX12_009526 [Alectoria sarmentosa]
MALVILPILIPLNFVHGRGPHFATGRFDSSTYTNVTGLDRLAWGDVPPDKNNRYWAHLVLAVGVVIYTCFVFFDELRGYIRLRQAYLTSPQHRLRASATTVLVTAIPPKWCTFEALDGLYDIFPGGIRNIWINRNFDELHEKVKRRNKLARSLESAETSLIKNAKRSHLRKLKAGAKKAGKRELKIAASEQLKAAEEQGEAIVQTDGISSGDPHQVRHTIDDALAESSNESSRERSRDRKKTLVTIPVLGQGMEAVGHGIGNFGKAVFGGFKTVGKGVDERLNTTGGFIPVTPESAAPRSKYHVDKANFGLDSTRSRSISPDSDYPYKIRDPSPGRNHQQSASEASNESTIRESTSRDGPAYSRSISSRDGEGLGIEGAPIDHRAKRDSCYSDILCNPERLGEAEELHKSRFNFWSRKKNVPYGIPSPTPHSQEEDEFPLSRPSPMTPGCNPQPTVNGPGSNPGLEGTKDQSQKSRKESTKDKASEKKAFDYPIACNEVYDTNGREPVWKRYLKEKDRETMRLPIFGWQWMISLPLLGQKVDTIDYCRKEVARLNAEVEQDQKTPERFPLMNSAFVQFNHQVAAHMACQAVSHHIPNQMAPRVVEISPDDVIWDNMSMRWWESYVRPAVVIVIIVGLVIGWAFPVSFTAVLSQIKTLTGTVKWLHWLANAPKEVFSIIQGVLPQAILALLLILLPIILRYLAKRQGDYTGMAVELSVQKYYFAFLFVQVFLVISISSGITTIITQITEKPQSVPSILATNLPKASNYFFSYLLLQALSVSAGDLVQIMGLIEWFLLAPLLDNTARQKWCRQTQLPNVQWGTFFPVYTNLACIGLVYSIISPLIMVFNIITFSLFWLVYRYNTLYVTKFRFDTGGLLYPTAINQLFTGLYLMELCLIGLFFLVKDADSDGSAVGTPCKVQGIIMIIVLILTFLYQWLLNAAFGPLLRYLPITLEDEAVMRDEEFARVQEKRFRLDENKQESNDINNVLRDRKSLSAYENRAAESIEMHNVEASNGCGRLDPRNLGLVSEAVGNPMPLKASSWADRSRKKTPYSPGQNGQVASPRQRHRQHHPVRKSPDIEAQRSGTDAMGEALFAGINDEIEDLTPDERNKLVQRAFQHEALRARRPVIWIPRDDLGVSDDEIYQTQNLSKYIWISNEFTGLDSSGRVVYRRSPPDFSEVDLIEL